MRLAAPDGAPAASRGRPKALPAAYGAATDALPESAGRARPVIARVRPCVDGGRYPAKGSVGEPVVVAADIFTDGHDELICELRFRHDDDRTWSTVRLRPLVNDRWFGELPVDRLGRYRFTVRATIDRFGTWRHALVVKAGAGQAVGVELQVGAELVAATAQRARGADRRALLAHAAGLRAAAEAAGEAEAAGAAGEAGDAGAASGTRAEPGVDLAGDPELIDLMSRYPDPGPAVASEAYTVLVDPPLARFSSWYELFPRSASPDASRPGTLADVEALLPRVAAMGFDVLYLPPVHPIGVTSRKGPNGSPIAGPGDPGSPWAIGGEAGGFTAIHPELGTIDDFDRLVQAAAGAGIAVAMDLAFQCSPDHPWVVEHPEWFSHLPDGSIRPAENPPKRYEDVFPFDFATAQWRELWSALQGVVEFWIGHGVRVFRVDNPHTKPMRFWEWLIATTRSQHPDVLFLAEAFTRPRVMEHLAKIGFSQSYTYFTWRNTKWELESYLGELVHSEVADYFRPNFWPNTPDILHATLQDGRRGAFVARLVLAATLSSNYGIYGPVFELQESRPRSPGSEEYLDSEKYEVRHWDLDRAGNLAPLVTTLNGARRVHRALQQNRTLHFHQAENDKLLVYSKTAPGPDVMLVVVSLDPANRQDGWVHLDLGALGIGPELPYVVRDLLTGARYEWTGARNYVGLDPDLPAHVFEVQVPGVPEPRIP